MSGRTDAVTDVRIVVEGLADAIRVSEALRGTSLGSDYGATVTALIPTTTPDIAKNAAFGADIVLLATDHDEAGDQLSVRMREVLEGLCGTVEQVRLPRGQNIEYTDAHVVRDALEKAIVRAGLSALRLYATPAYETDEPYPELEEACSCEEEEPCPCCRHGDEESGASDEHETDELLFEINRLQIENATYEARVGDLERKVNELLIDAYERFDLEDVWTSLYDDEMPDPEEVSFAASRVSDEVFVSNNFIFARSLKKVEDFLQTFRETLSQ